MSEAECPYCGEMAECREIAPAIRYAGNWIAADYSCEDCYEPRDDDPCFDDLPEYEPPEGLSK